jgi:hypothetical protein|tara:strand:- start:249 stop:563 length:315 start_codon:yes stop_codon:yes gene_type:complete
MRKWIASIAGLLVLAVIIYTQITIFVVPPMGALPEGRTVVLLRLNKTKFIDSADAMCKRLEVGGPVLCRGLMMAAVLHSGTILAKLPYSESLYLISTDGKAFEP